MPEFKPVAYGVLEGRDIESCGFGYIASFPHACHDHINDAISEHNIEGAGTWKVVEFFTADQLNQAYAAGQADGKAIPMKYRHMEFNAQLQAELVAAREEIKTLQANLRMSKWERAELELIEQLATSQADNERLREALNAGANYLDILGGDSGRYRQVLSTKPDNSALREHDAKLVERIADMVVSMTANTAFQSVDHYNFASTIADKIREGKF